jgi:hypothetical protein
MAFAYISEYLRQPKDGVSLVLPAGMEPALAVQRVAIGGGSVQSTPFNPKTTFIAVNVDVTCSYAVGENPTATTSSMRISQDATIYLGVKPGDRIAVISNT